MTEIEAKLEAYTTLLCLTDKLFADLDDQYLRPAVLKIILQAAISGLIEAEGKKKSSDAFRNDRSVAN